MKSYFTLFYLLISSFAYSQDLSFQDSLLKNDVETVNKQIDFMFEIDQKYRNYLLYGTFDRRIIDSIDKLSSEEISTFKKANKLDSIVFEIARKQLQQIDSINTLQIIELTKKYGFPSNLRLVTLRRKPSSGGAYFLLIHSPRYFEREIREIAKTAYQLGRLNEQCYKHVLWHLNGRRENLMKAFDKSIEELEGNK